MRFVLLTPVLPALPPLMTVLTVTFTVPTEELLLKLINSVPNARRILSVLETAGEVREFFASEESSETTYQQIESAIRQVDVSMVKRLRVMLANADDRATPVLWRQAVFGLNSPRARRSV